MRRSQVLPYAILVLASAVVLFPYLWMVGSSIRPIEGFFSVPLRWLPERATLDNYRVILADPRFLRSLANSAIVSVLVTALSLLLSIPAAYGLTRLVRRGGRGILFAVLASQFFPPMVFFVPFYLILQAAGALNTLGGLVFAYLSVTLPITAWMVATALRDIPAEIEEAARIDGAGDLGVILRVVLPLAAPGIATAAVFAFVLSWQEYIFALLYTSTPAAQTAPVILFTLVGQHQIDYGQLMAAAVLLSLPVAAPFILIQRAYRGGLAQGGVKG